MGIFKHKIAWAAGFFEGEGCFYAYKAKQREDGSCLVTPRASLTQKDISLLYIFQEIVGFGTINNSSKDVKVWQTSRKGEAEKIFLLFQPWLSERRQNRFKEIKRMAEESFIPLGAHQQRRITTHCPQGHERTGRGYKNRRYCIQCQRQANQRYYEQKTKSTLKKSLRASL